jgi:hypothetical protein
VSPKWEQCTAGDECGWIRRWSPLCINDASGSKFFPSGVCDKDLASRNRRGREVENHRTAVGREAGGDRVRAIGTTRPTVWNRGMREAETSHPCQRGHAVDTRPLHVVAKPPEMGAPHEGDSRDAVLAGPGDCLVRRHDGSSLAKPPLATHGRRWPGIPDQTCPPDRIEDARTRLPNVIRQTKHPVRIVARQVRVDEMVSNERRNVGRRADSLEDRRRENPKGGRPEPQGRGHAPTL